MVVVVLVVVKLGALCLSGSPRPHSAFGFVKASIIPSLHSLLSLAPFS